MSDTFRWQALFQNCHEPIFVLGPRRQLVFANRAWEVLTGRSTEEVRGVTCTRRKSASDHADLAAAMTPTPEVLEGRAVRIQRPRPGRDTGPPWWEIDFLPLMGEGGLIGIVGRIRAETTVTTTITRPLTESQAAFRNLVADQHRLESLEHRFPSLGTVLAQARLAAASHSPVFILGEPGVGKEWLARAIHCAGHQRERPFMAIDAAALPSAAVAGVLFGPLGLYRSDGAGTIYIHEPARLPLDVQDELAQRIAGGSDSDPRVIAGAVAEPMHTDAKGSTLPALVYALTVLIVRLPPLRERTLELPAIVAMTLERLSDKSVSVSPEAVECIAAYPWPGNLDELQSSLHEAIQSAADNRIEVTNLPLPVRQARSAADLQRTAEPPFPTLDHVLDNEERRLIRLALEKAKGNQTRAAEMLSIWRPRLIRRMKALGIDDI